MYRDFVAEVQSQTKIDPSKPQAGLALLPLISLVSAIISVGLTIAASFFKPKSKSGGGRENVDGSGPTVVGTSAFAPKSGFDSVQQPAGIGLTIPLVYANRESLGVSTNPPRPAGLYGGVRVSTPLIWSAMLSLGGSQMLRSIFLLGEGSITGLDLKGFAIGDNSISTYDLISSSANSNGSRLSIYYRPDGGRIRSSDLILGRAAAQDIGNAENSGGADVFAIRGLNNTFGAHFCYTSKPSSGTTFGVFAHCPNNMSMRVAPNVRPTTNFGTRVNTESSYRVDNSDDVQAQAETWKSKYSWSSRSGIYGTSSGSSPGIYFLGVDATISYRQDASADTNTTIRFLFLNSDLPANLAPISFPVGETKGSDIAATVSGRQRSADDSLQLGEVFKIGSALAVLVSRSSSTGEDIFRSDNDQQPPGGGSTMYYLFRVVKPGYVQVVPESAIVPPTTGQLVLPPFGRNNLPFFATTKYGTATNTAQIFRAAIATVLIPRVCRVFEIGLRSTVGIRVSGLTNFRDTLPIANLNFLAGDLYDGFIFGNDVKLNTATFQSGTISSNELRYSFFRIYYRAGMTGDFTSIPATFGVRSMTSQAVNNYIRFQMPADARYELRIEPLTGWEIRTGYGIEGPLVILDGKSSYNNGANYGGILVYWTGTVVNRDQTTFRIPSLEPLGDLGYGFTDSASMTDDWARVAEVFAYENIQTTATNGPEHEIVYINTITPNITVPQYDNLAIIGLNIRASSEWSQLSQVSAYVTAGRSVARYLNGNTEGPSHLFPDIFRDILLNDRFGTGEEISPEQINNASFLAAAGRCNSRRYFFDGVINNKNNVRTWGANVANSMLHDLVEKDGQFALEPSFLFPEDGPVPVRALFTAGNIEEDTFKLEFLEADDRQPIQVSVKWRSERERTAYTESGLFPVEREVLVREADRPDTDPIEAIDISDYCTNLEHAIDLACYMIRIRRLITHAVSFKTTHEGVLAGLSVGDYIKVAMDYTFYDEFAHGAILENGTLVTTRPDALGVGTHPASIWYGTDSPIIEGTITVSADGKASPRGVAFVKKEVTSQVRTYKIEKLSIDVEGKIQVEAVHHPTDSSGISEIGKRWTTYVTDANWIISS